MTELFDAYRDTYSETVAASISFSTLPHDFFLAAKVEMVSELFAHHFGPHARPSLLDIGCGVGQMHRFLRPHVGELAGCDPSAQSIERARQDNPGVAYKLAGGSLLPWDTARFDCALAVCVMHHVPRQDWTSFAVEMRRVVRPGGLVIVIEHNPFNPLTRLAVFRCPFDEDAVLLRAGRTRALLRAAGCAEVQSRHFLLFPFSTKTSRAVERVMEKAPLGAQYVAFGVA
jgi:SAM-dependent methyltransferase